MYRHGKSMLKVKLLDTRRSDLELFHETSERSVLRLKSTIMQSSYQFFKFKSIDFRLIHYNIKPYKNIHIICLLQMHEKSLSMSQYRLILKKLKHALSKCIEHTNIIIKMQIYLRLINFVHY